MPEPAFQLNVAEVEVKVVPGTGEVMDPAVAPNAEMTVKDKNVIRTATALLMPHALRKRFEFIDSPGSAI
jgi:hypothetical protein